MALLRKQRPEFSFRYTIIGDGELQEKLQQQIESLKLSDYVFLAGRKKHEEVFEAMGTEKIYIQPSRWEGLCNATLEAMSIGLPVLVSRISPFTEYIEEGLNGWFFEKENAVSLYEKLNAMLNTDLTKTREMARQTIAEKFSIEGQMKAMKEMIEYVQQCQKPH